ncbi:MAG: acyl-CoA thioesterase [Firmicutes bacterium HGW-Firmicutes-12]|jgi:acyl-CoA hydrolase|nr:MAG: acyl-CoA thioesterase [Firmicutes bacterium HGW-Firmicutes-12]
MEEKTISYSSMIMSQVMLPNQANPAGNVHGGEIMKIMDSTAGVVSKKHSRLNTVTARVDELVFHLPIFVGDLLTCKAHLVYVGRSSMEVAVTVEVEDMEIEQEPQKALSAYFTMVGMDKKGTPSPVPPLKLETPEEKAAFEDGRLRYEIYKQKKQKKK